MLLLRTSLTRSFDVSLPRHSSTFHLRPELPVTSFLVAFRENCYVFPLRHFVRDFFRTDVLPPFSRSSCTSPSVFSSHRTVLVSSARGDLQHAVLGGFRASPSFLVWSISDMCLPRYGQEYYFTASIGQMLISRAYQTVSFEVPSFRPPGDSFSVYATPLRLFYFSEVSYLSASSSFGYRSSQKGSTFTFTWTTFYSSARSQSAAAGSQARYFHLHGGRLCDQPGKIHFAPSQDLVFLGGCFRTNVGMVFLPEEILQIFVSLDRSFFSTLYLPARPWLRLLGLMVSAF